MELDRPTSGKVLIDGTDVFEMKDKELAAFRNKHVGFIFQFHQLLPEFTALENVCIPAMIAREKEAEYTARAEQLLRELGLGDRMDHKPNELSGGEKQRVEGLHGREYLEGKAENVDCLFGIEVDE